MATSKFAFTDLQAFRIALVMANGSTCEEAIREVMNDKYDIDKRYYSVENYARKISHKIHVIERANAKPAGKSKVRIANENIANAYLATLASEDVFNLSDLMNANPEVTTYSKAAAIVNIMIENNSVVRNGSHNGKSIYKVA